VPTFREVGYPGVESLGQFGLLVPAGTPDDTIERLNKVVRAAVETNAVKAGLAKLSLDPAESSSAEFAQLIASETQRWGEIVKASGFQPMD
jgi:tripartite-type tricarboxylate transporter receptor subunit TctC